MPDQKLSQLPAASPAKCSDLLYAVQNNNSTRAVAGQITMAGDAYFINGLGDSITAAANFQPTDTSLASVPAWQPSTSYTNNQSVVQNGGLAYYCTQTGTSAGSGGPTGTGSSIVDNTARWAYLYPHTTKRGDAYLTWVEIFSGGRLRWEMAQGYGGLPSALIKIIVKDGGSNYTAPTVTLNNGATGTVQTTGGVITSVTITNPGRGSNFTWSINDGTGSGAVLSLVAQPSGTFGVPGCKTIDMVARLPDCVASSVDIFVVHGGTNDLTANDTYATITGNLRQCYETLMAAGKRVIAVPILPRTGLTNTQMTVLMRVNHWIRAYCRKESWANASQYPGIVLADATGFFTDGANVLGLPVGGSSAAYPALTLDGLHPSPRGAMMLGHEIWLAAQRFCGVVSAQTSRIYTAFDGVDSSVNPAGNYVEALPWAASTAYSVGQLRSNNSNIYLCATAGSSASSGGPSGTGSGIADGGATWNYVRPNRMSVFASGTAGTNNAAAGITFVGNLASGYTLARLSGSASGTVTESIESPLSNGLAGQRQVITFSLGSGTSTESWRLHGGFTGGSYSTVGITAAELGSLRIYAEMELELSAVANLQQLYLELSDNNAAFYNHTGNYTYQTGNINNMLFSSGDMMNYPNNGKIWLRTQSILLPTNTTNILSSLRVVFDASGGAGSATATFKIHYFGIRRQL